MSPLAHRLSHAIDIMPTLLDLAGAVLDRQQPLPLEGHSLRNTFQKSENQPIPARTIFWSHSKGKAIRYADWKLVSQSKQDWKLYQLPEDGTELQNLADKFPDRVADMIRRFNAWDKRTDFGKKPK